MKESAIMSGPSAEEVITATRVWLERAVIGLNLCPFAKAVYTKERVRYVVSEARSIAALVADLQNELQHLAQADREVTETTLLIHPQVLTDFLDYNDFLEIADGVVAALGLEGTLQVASFHPQYQFADTEPDDITNYSNRAPYPTLHLLREVSVDEAVAAFPEAETIYEKNIETLRQLGHAGWKALGLKSGG